MAARSAKTLPSKFKIVLEKPMFPHDGDVVAAHRGLAQPKARRPMGEHALAGGQPFRDVRTAD